MIKHIETLAVEVAKDERKLIETKNEYDLKLRTVEENLKKTLLLGDNTSKFNTEQKQINKNNYDDLLRINDTIFNQPKQYGFILDIGTHMGFPIDGKNESLGKITSHIISFPFQVLEDRMNIQHTLITHTSNWKDDLSSHIRTVKLDTTVVNKPGENLVVTTKLTIELYTFRSNGTHHWGIHFHAYLLVTIFRDNILTIKNSSTSL